jgi:thiol-disulfide isomerase/thioredoxin
LPKRRYGTKALAITFQSLNSHTSPDFAVEQSTVSRVYIDMTKTRIAIVGATLGIVGLLLMPARTADLGQPAAPLKIAEWVKGKPVDLAEAKGKQVVVVEFWATWCGPCRTSIPHLTKLQKKYQDQNVVFVGVTDEKADVVKPFVKKMGDQMDYTIAIDQGGQTARGYMQAYGQNGIPTAFIVDKAGNVVWLGHPMGELEQTLEAVLAGTYDMKTAQRRAEAMELLQRFFTSMQGENPDEAAMEKLAERIAQLDEELGGIIPGERFTTKMLMSQARAGRLLQGYQEAVLAGADAARLAALEAEIRPQLPDDVNFDDIKAQMLGGKLMTDYLQAVVEGKAEVAGKLKPRVLQELKGQPQMLNSIAWTIATEETVPQRDLKFALEVAKLAMEVTEEKEANIIDTYARVLFENGQVAEAVRFQEKALKLAGDDAELKATLQKSLDEFRAKLNAAP